MPYRAHRGCFMYSNRRSGFTSLLAVLSILSVHSGLRGGELYRDDDKHFQMTLPDEWETSPQELLDRVNDVARRSGLAYDKRFGPKKAMPYLLVQWLPGATRGATYEKIEKAFRKEAIEEPVQRVSEKV